MSEGAFTQIGSGRLILRRFKDSVLTLFVAYRNDPEVACQQARDFVGENPDGRRPAAIDAQVLTRASGSRRRSTCADRGGNDGPT
jgi:hypothetical protein